jgi:putative transposase
MARPLRIEYEGAFYHVTSRGNERKKIFLGRTDYERFRTYLKEGRAKYRFILHGYVLLVNHYHLLIETPDGNLSRIMHFLNSSYSTYFNLKHKRGGHLFQGRFKAHLVDKDSYLLELSRYLHLNPVRAGLVEKPEAYPYSSYRTYIGSTADEIVYPHLGWAMIAATEPAVHYRRFVEDGLACSVQDPLQGLYGGLLLGGEDFIRESLERVKRLSTLKEDVSHRRAMKASDLETVVRRIAYAMHTSREALLARRNAFRNMAIYFSKRYTSATNREIGDFFGGISYSAVTKVCERFEKKLSDPKLKRKASMVARELSNVKG